MIGDGDHHGVDVIAVDNAPVVLVDVGLDAGLGGGLLGASAVDVAGGHHVGDVPLDDVPGVVAPAAPGPDDADTDAVISAENAGG